MTLEISPAQALVLSMIATVLVFVFRRLAAANIKLSRRVVTTLLVLISLVLALLWARDTLPPFPSGDDAAAWLMWLGNLFIALSPIIAFATLIYNWFAKELLEWLAVQVRRAFLAPPTQRHGNE